MEACPVCDVRLPAAELQDHVELHFLPDEQQCPAGGPDVDGPEVVQSGLVSCPYGCGAMVLLEDLDSHEEAHRLQEFETEHTRLHQAQEAAEFEKLQMKYGFSDKVPPRPGRCFSCGEEGHWSRDCPNNPAARARQPLTTNPLELARIQQPDRVIQQQQCMDIMPLLRSCFQAQQKPRTTVYLSGPVAFCSRGALDSGWGCGYRNIQMQVSHLLQAAPQHKQALFGGAGFIPDIPALQAWLEVAWQAGFDPGGAAMFGSAVQSTRKWIGTTEAAAMLRYFGCRALIVDFYGCGSQGTDKQLPTVHQGVACDICSVTPILGVRFKSCRTPDFDVCCSCSKLPQARQHAPYVETGSSARGDDGVGPAHNQSASMASAVDCTGERTAAAAGPHGAPQADAFPAAADTSTHEMGLSRRKQPYAGDKKHGAKRHQALAEWIWAYFSSTGCPHVLDGCQTTLTSHAEPAAAPRGDASSGRQPHAGAHLSDDSSSSSVKQHGPINAFTLLRQQGSVIMTGKPPLYFQHEGHSRTIVGIEKTLPLASQQLQQSRTADGGASTANTAAEYNLVVLDPGMPQDQLYSSLRTRDKWQAKVKRGMHSLARHSELQLLYVAPGLVPEGPARDALKKVVASERYR